MGGLIVAGSAVECGVEAAALVGLGVVVRGGVDDDAACTRTLPDCVGPDSAGPDDAGLDSVVVDDPVFDGSGNVELGAAAVVIAALAGPANSGGTVTRRCAKPTLSAVVPGAVVRTAVGGSARLAEDGSSEGNATNNPSAVAAVAARTSARRSTVPRYP